jgi:protein MpaA
MKFLFLLTILTTAAQARPWRERFAEFKNEFALLQPLSGCLSKGGEELLHYMKPGKQDGKRILVLSMIHGNELPAGEIGFRWIRRLEKLSPHNSWFVVPVLNPDGVQAVTRTNQTKIDLNRHFPTKDWEAEALKYWKKLGGAPAKFPGDKPATEPEVQCVVSLIESYKPHLIVSIHTPFGVLDYDGPGKVPKYLPLKWKSLGHYPGSLGRYAWAERGIPVLTIELPEKLPVGLAAKMDRFQDELSYLAQ